MATVIASLPKVIVFVALGTPSSEHSKGARVGKVIAIGVVVVITCTSLRLFPFLPPFLMPGYLPTYLPAHPPLVPLILLFCFVLI